MNREKAVVAAEEVMDEQDDQTRPKSSSSSSTNTRLQRKAPKRNHEPSDSSSEEEETEKKRSCHSHVDEAQTVNDSEDEDNGKVAYEPVHHFQATVDSNDTEYYTEVHRFVDQIALSQDEAANYKIIKPSSKPNREAEPVRIVHAEADNPFLFHVGLCTIELKKLANQSYSGLVQRGANVEDNLASVFLYTQELRRFYGYQMRYNQVTSTGYRLLFTTKGDDPQKPPARSFMFEIERENEMTSVLLNLFQKKLVRLVFEAVDFADNRPLQQLNVNVFLTSKLKLNEHILDYPSMYYRNLDTADLNYLFGVYFFSKMNIQLRLGNVEENAQLNEKEMEFSDEKPKENLFDMIHDLRSRENVDDRSIGIGASVNDRIQEMSSMNVSLRPYQIEAVKWMLYKERFKGNQQQQKAKRDEDDENGDEIHPLYLQLTNGRSQTIYLHKYFFIFSTEMPLKQKALNGGILADEMGLGKTLEILSLIQINQRHVTPEEQHRDNTSDAESIASSTDNERAAEKQSASKK
jgi:SNF2 family DNA or RNA helicase